MEELAKLFHRPASLKAFGKAVRQVREKRGMTLESLAAETGISKPYLAHIETARTPGPPTEGKLKALAKGLGLEPRVMVEAGDWLHTPASVRRAVLRGEGPRRADGAMDLDAMMGRNHGGTKGVKEKENEKGKGGDVGTYGDMIGVKRVPLINRVAAG
ncbi:MAG TPA: helix-turn-helix transcriptional regulator, partial [Phycisphaerae bacterium]|nr:helix-turn-helix transcriptional regulator [Phycisphaerae bacterium]